jgi:hypothetical protein
MQPTYFPWAGYFNLIQGVDAFVLLDDAQYERSSWQNRNRVLVNSAPRWLTVPVLREFLGAPLNAVRTDDKLPWRRKHLALLTQSYGRHPDGPAMLEVVQPIADALLDVLAELNIRLLRDLCARLGIGTLLLRSSELAVEGKRTGHLIGICERLGCDEYLSPPGALEYLMEDGFVELTGTRLLINDYEPAPYPQRGTAAFVSNLSILDVVANMGWAQAAAYVRRPATLREIHRA